MRTGAGSLRFHWSIPASGGVDRTRGAQSREQTNSLPDVDVHIAFCRLAEESGVDSVLVPIGFFRADPVTMAAVLGPATSRVRFMLASRSGIVSPTYFVQQLNTISLLTGGRVSINSVAGHSQDEQRFYGDLLPHDARYARTEEFWTVCHRLWDADGPVDFAGRYYTIEGARVDVPFVAPDRTRPELYLGGNSSAARRVAMAQADCHLQFADAPERLAPLVAPVLDTGTEVGLVLSMIVRPTRAEALRAAQELIDRAGEQALRAQQRFRSRLDAVGYVSVYELAERGSDWLTPYLWTGAVPYLGPTALSLVGDPEDVAAGLLEFGRIGITQFVFQGRPDIEVMSLFGRHVLPLIRTHEPQPAGR
jgi:alkanesulfonate monooxygenase